MIRQIDGKISNSLSGTVHETFTKIDYTVRHKEYKYFILTQDANAPLTSLTTGTCVKIELKNRVH